MLQNGLALQFAPDEIRSDRDLLLEVVRDTEQGWRALEFAAPDFRCDREILLLAIRSGWDGWKVLSFADASLRGPDGRDVVLEAVRCNGRALQFATAELRADRDVVSAAIQQSGWA